jgi:integrase
LNDAERYRIDPTRRWPTRYRGVSYRLDRSLKRSYFVYDRGKFIPAGATESAGLGKQADLRAKRARGERVVIASRKTLSEVAEDWYADAERRLRLGTLKNYRSDLDRVILPRFGERGVGSIGPEDIVELVKELEGAGKAGSTIANALKPLSGTFGYAVFKGLIAVNPMTQIPRGYRPSCSVTREHREWTTAEVDRMIAEARKLDARPEARCAYAPITEFLLRTGVRLGEALGAQFGDIDFEAGVFNLTRQFTKDGRLAEPKTKWSTRRVPIAPGLLKQLAARSLELDADPGTFLFAPKKGELPPTQSNYRRRGWNLAKEKAGLTDGPRLTPHDSRHGFTSQLAELGLPSSDLAPILGHSTAGITEAIYTHAFNREAREARVREAMAAAIGAAD